MCVCVCVHVCVCVCVCVIVCGIFQKGSSTRQILNNASFKPWVKTICMELRTNLSVISTKLKIQGMTILSGHLDIQI